MLRFTTDTMELRGIISKVSQKTNRAYYVLLCEDESTEQHKFICKDFNVIPQGLCKGDLITLRLSYNSYKDFDVIGVEKAV